MAFRSKRWPGSFRVLYPLDCAYLECCRELSPEGLRHGIVKQRIHPTISRSRPRPRGLKNFSCLLPRHRRVAVKEVFETISCLQMLDQDAYGDPGSGEYGGSAEDAGISTDPFVVH